MTIVPSVGPWPLLADAAERPPVPDPWGGVNLPSPFTIALFVLGLLALIVLAQLLYRAAIPAGGFATAWQIHRHLSAHAAKRNIGLTRPSLGRGRSVPVDEYSYWLGRSFSPWMHVRCSPEDCALLIGPPGVGKSLLLAAIVRRAPGAVVYTTSKIADYDNTAAERSLVGPVVTFNPLGLGGVESNLRINPVRGCRNLDVAIRRGAALLYGSRRHSDDNAGGLQAYFDSNANEVLRAFLLAADLEGLTLVDVHRWANDPRCTDALKILDRHNAPTLWIDALRARQEVTDRTRDGIFSTLATALSWMSDPAASRVVTPGPGEEIDWEAFLKARGTLYMVGEDSTAGGSTAPLFTLILTDLVEAAIHLADRMPGRRLDPWLTLALDEVATICPLPLPIWFNTMRGHGLLPIASIQSKAQLYERWGRHGGDSVWNAAAATVVFGGLKSDDDLREISALCGERDVVRKSRQHSIHGTTHSETDEQRPIMPVHRIRNLRRGRALVLHRNVPPVIVRVRAGLWRRPQRPPAPSLPPTTPTPSVTVGGDR